MLSDSMRYISSQRGYTLLFAVLTAALVLGVAVFITNISRKQYILASTARDSMFAIYAADSGIDCAALAVNSGSGIASTSFGNAPIPCAGNVYTPLNDSSHIPLVSWTYQTIALDNKECAIVKLTFMLDSSGAPETIVDSSGYNVCTAVGQPLGPDTSQNSQAVERALRLTYGGVW